jgi:eukaryotic-like serine/threonine-protein kinase
MLSLNRFTFFLYFIAVSFFLAAAVQAQTVPAASEWLHSRGNPAMTGESPVQLRFPLTLAWQKPLMEKPAGRQQMLLSSAVVRQGKVYVGAKDGSFHCLNLADGAQVWKVQMKGGFDGAAAFAGDLVIAGSQDGFVYAWKAETGEPAWKYPTAAEIHASANVWSDPGTGKQKILIGSYDYQLHCLDAITGKADWTAESGYYINGGSAVADERVVFGGCDSFLHVHEVRTGKELRQIDVGAYIGNNVALAHGCVYVSHYGNRVHAFQLGDGKQLWEYGEREFEFYAAPAVNEKAVFLGGRDKRFHAIDRQTGQKLWEYRCRDRIDSSAVICADQSVLFGCDDGYFYALNAADGKELWQYEIGAAIKTNPAVTEEFILIGADDGQLYAFKNPR